MPYKDPENRRERDRRYYLEHREEIRKAQQRYHAEHRDDRNEYSRRYHAEHPQAKDPQRVRDYQRRYRAEHPEEDRAKARRYYAKHREEIRKRGEKHRASGRPRDNELRRKYGLDLRQWMAKLAEQGGLCAICRMRPATDTDHSHETGVVRGLLCSSCNKLLGYAGDDADVLLAAVEYLARYSALAADRQLDLPAVAEGGLP